MKRTVNLRAAIQILALIGMGWPLSASAADLTMRFIWDGALPELKPIANPFPQDCRNVDLNQGRQFVDADSKGIRDVVVYVAPSRRDRKKWKHPQQDRSLQIGLKDCRIEPRILFAQVGDHLNVSDRDDVGHSLNFSFFANVVPSFYVPVKHSYTIKLRSPEPAPVPVRCNIHPWEEAYLFVLDHTFIGASDREGRLVLRDLPHGEVPLRIWHPNGTIVSLRIGNEHRNLEKGRLSLSVDDTQTDLGQVVIKADNFLIRQAARH